jgi:hypothetical protein
MKAAAAERDRSGEGFGQTLFVQDPFLREINLGMCVVTPFEELRLSNGHPFSRHCLGRFVTTYSWTKIQARFAEAEELLRTCSCAEDVQKLYSPGRGH